MFTVNDISIVQGSNEEVNPANAEDWLKSLNMETECDNIY